MLVLSRKLNETTVVTTKSGDRITVTIVEIDRGKIRLGFEADASVVIHRGEVQARVDEENQLAGGQ